MKMDASVRSAKRKFKSSALIKLGINYCRMLPHPSVKIHLTETGPKALNLSTRKYKNYFLQISLLVPDLRVRGFSIIKHIFFLALHTNARMYVDKVDTCMQILCSVYTCIMSAKHGGGVWRVFYLEIGN